MIQQQILYQKNSELAQYLLENELLEQSEMLELSQESALDQEVIAQVNTKRKPIIEMKISLINYFLKIVSDIRLFLSPFLLYERMQQNEGSPSSKLLAEYNQGRKWIEKITSCTVVLMLLSQIVRQLVMILFIILTIYMFAQHQIELLMIRILWSGKQISQLLNNQSSELQKSTKKAFNFIGDIETIARSINMTYTDTVLNNASSLIEGESSTKEHEVVSPHFQNCCIPLRSKLQSQLYDIAELNLQVLIFLLQERNNCLSILYEKELLQLKNKLSLSDLRKLLNLAFSINYEILKVLKAQLKITKASKPIFFLLRGFRILQKIVDKQKNAAQQIDIYWQAQESQYESTKHSSNYNPSNQFMKKAYLHIKNLKRHLQYLELNKLQNQKQSSRYLESLQLEINQLSRLVKDMITNERETTHQPTLSQENLEENKTLIQSNTEQSEYNQQKQKQSHQKENKNIIYELEADFEYQHGEQLLANHQQSKQPANIELLNQIKSIVEPQQFEVIQFGGGSKKNLVQNDNSDIFSNKSKPALNFLTELKEKQQFSSNQNILQ